MKRGLTTDLKASGAENSLDFWLIWYRASISFAYWSLWVKTWVPLNKNETVVKAQNFRAVFFPPRDVRVVEDRSAETLTVNHFLVGAKIAPPAVERRGAERFSR